MNTEKSVLDVVVSTTNQTNEEEKMSTKQTGQSYVNNSYCGAPMWCMSDKTRSKVFELSRSVYGEMYYYDLASVPLMEEIVNKSDNPFRTWFGSIIYADTHVLQNDLNKLYTLCENAKTERNGGASIDELKLKLHECVKMANTILTRNNFFLSVFESDAGLKVLDPIEIGEKEYVDNPSEVIVRCFTDLEWVEDNLLKCGLKHPDLYFALEVTETYR